MTEIKRILLTPGEPAGIGPDITLRIAEQSWPAQIVVVADPDLLAERAKQLNLSIQLIETNLEKDPTPHIPGTLNILPLALKSRAQAGKLNLENSNYVLKTLEQAASLCQERRAHALVTGPVHKQALNDAGIAFSGHTEFLAQHTGVQTTVMLFVLDHMRIALATTHLPLADVSKAITKETLTSTITTLSQGLTQYFNISEPHIFVCGLNPHAGEGGHLGSEEIKIISPTIQALQKQHYQLTGPLPADTIFTPNVLKGADAVLAMYHDQALPLIKYLGFDRAVNMTLGLPFLRTSVDHGTALTFAGTGYADPGSLNAALKLAMSSP